MAAGSLASPGTEVGPCADPCEHRDCATTRRMAETACVHCSDPIGYGTSFYNVTPDGEPVWSKLAHAGCELAAVEAEQTSLPQTGQR